MTARLSSERRVLFPAPRLPSIEITPDILAIKPLNHKLNFQSELILVRIMISMAPLTGTLEAI